jgi:hypothetical protein
MQDPIATQFETEFKRYCCDPRCTENQIAQLRFSYMAGAAAAMNHVFKLQSTTLVMPEDIQMVKEIAAELAAFSRNIYQPARVFNL